MQYKKYYFKQIQISTFYLLFSNKLFSGTTKQNIVTSITNISWELSSGGLN